MRLFNNQRQAAEELGKTLQYLKPEEPIIVGLANGGVPVAEVVAEALDAPLDVLLLARLTAPQPPHNIVGAVDEHGRISLIRSAARWHHLTSQQMIDPAREAFRDLQHRRGRIRAILPEQNVHGRMVVLISQCVVSGAKMLGAIASVRDRGAAKVVAAAPAGCSRASWPLHEAADMVVIPHQSGRIKHVRDVYHEHREVTDEVVCGLVERWVARHAPQQPGVRTIVARFPGPAEGGGSMLACEIDLPPGVTRGSGPYPAVVFAHGFESNARSPRSVPISRRLAKRGIIGARMDFTGHGRSEGAEEDATPQRMLHDLHAVFNHVARLDEVDANRMGLNGAGTGGMIALHYAAQQPLVRALVIRGPVCGKEIEAASRIKAPTLLIHAEYDAALREPVEAIDRALAGPHELLRVPEANRLFNDPISLELMVGASVQWFADHVTAVPSSDDRPGVTPSSAAQRQSNHG